MASSTSRSWFFAAALALATAVTAGCGGAGAAGHARGVARNGEGPAAPVTAVSDDAFAGAIRDTLLSEPGTRQREARLSGVLARQMVRAVARFHAHRDNRGLGSVLAAFYLVRTGELRPESLGESGAPALREAVRELAGRGDEGRSRALYEILQRIVPPAQQADAKAHLDALSGWVRDQAASSPQMIASGFYESVAVSRRLLEPSAPALQDAVNATTDWIHRGVALRQAVHDRRASPSREEVIEAVRAIQSGASVLAALYLRDADAVGALGAIDKAQARDLARPELVKALEVVIDKPDADHWLDVLHALAPDEEAGRADDEQGVDDRDLLRAATFGIASEAYRLDPTQPEAAVRVAAILEELGMGEASPAVIVDATRARADARSVSTSLAIMMHAMSAALEADDPDAARRTFAAGAPLLALADKRELAGKLQPSAARARAMMGDIEMREGRLDAARQLLTQSAAAERSGAVLLALSRIEWHDGHVAQALERLRDALSANDVAHDSALRGEILLTISDLVREQGDVSGARTPLSDALKELAKARNTPDADDRARVERLLSRVLDRFGAAQRAQQALERAFEATPHDKRQIAATLGQLVGRAFVRGDLPAARDGLARALAAELDGDDLVYYALWVRLLERQLHRATDGVPQRVFNSVVDDGRWTGRLAAFGAGKIKADELIASAKTPTQRTEALFYAAMDRRASGDAKGADDALKQVLSASELDLLEVGFARDILSGTHAQIGGPLPSDVALP